MRFPLLRFMRSCKTAQHAPQRMEHHPKARWLDPADPCTTSTVVKVADAGSQLFESSREESPRVSSCELTTVFKHPRSAPRGSGLQCPSKSGGDGSVGRIRPHTFNVAGGAQESQGPGSRVTCGRAHCVLENVHRTREEEDLVATMLPGPRTP